MKDEEKKLDCIEMQDRAALAIYQRTKEMTFEELVAYWKARNEEMRKQFGAAKQQVKRSR